MVLVKPKDLFSLKQHKSPTWVQSEGKILHINFVYKSKEGKKDGGDIVNSYPVETITCFCFRELLMQGKDFI